MMLPFHLVAIGLSITRRWSTDKGQDLWYGRGRKYWQGTSSSSEGMLCGSAHVHGADIADSENFLTKPVNDHLHFGRSYAWRRPYVRWMWAQA